MYSGPIGFCGAEVMMLSMMQNGQAKGDSLIVKFNQLAKSFCRDD